MNADELIYEREQARSNKDWKRSDEIRHALDAINIFIFDTKDGQEVYFLTESYFKFKDAPMSNRQYVEFRIKEDIRAEAALDAWIYTNLKRLT